MAINQLSSSNTFGQWLTTTQALVTKYNALEDTTNLVFDTANSTIEVYNNTVNVYIETTEVYDETVNVYNNTVNVYVDTVDVFNDTTNVYIDIQNYVESAYDTANTVQIIAQNSYDVANAALEVSNTVFENVFSIVDETANTDSFFPLFTDKTIGIPQDVYVSSTKLSYTPSTGNLFSTILSSQSVSTGNVTASGLVSAQDFNSTSDISLKENVVQIENPLSVIENLTGIKFNWKDTKETSYGLSAQEVEKVLPEIVKTRENGLKGVNYLNIIAILIESVKELKNEIENLKKNK
jgi:hypothetical protein